MKRNFNARKKGEAAVIKLEVKLIWIEKKELKAY